MTLKRLNLNLDIPDMGDARRKAIEADARHCPSDFSMTSTPITSTIMTGNRDTQQPARNMVIFSWFFVCFVLFCFVLFCVLLEIHRNSVHNCKMARYKSHRGKWNPCSLHTDGQPPDRLSHRAFDKNRSQNFTPLINTSKLEQEHIANVYKPSANMRSEWISKVIHNINHEFPYGVFLWIPQNNAKLKLTCKFGESKCNPCWDITLMTSHGMNYVLNEHLYFRQHGPYAIPSEIILWCS